MSQIELEFPDQRDAFISCVREVSDEEQFLTDYTGKKSPYALSYNFNHCTNLMEMLNFEDSREENAVGTLFYTIEEYRAAMDFFWACDRLDDSIDYGGRSEVKNEVIQGNPLYKNVIETARKALALLTSYKGE